MYEERRNKEKVSRGIEEPKGKSTHKFWFADNRKYNVVQNQDTTTKHNIKKKNAVLQRTTKEAWEYHSNNDINFLDLLGEEADPRLIEAWNNGRKETDPYIVPSTQYERDLLKDQIVQNRHDWIYRFSENNERPTESVLIGMDINSPLNYSIAAIGSDKKNEDNLSSHVTTHFTLSAFLRDQNKEWSKEENKKFIDLIGQNSMTVYLYNTIRQRNSLTQYVDGKQEEVSNTITETAYLIHKYKYAPISDQGVIPITLVPNLWNNDTAEAFYNILSPLRQMNHHRRLW